MPLFEQVLDSYPETVKVVFKHYPLSFHKKALPAALASLAAAEQGKFWEYHDELFFNQSSLSNQKYREIAKDIGLNQEKFNKDFLRPSLRKKVEQDLADGKKAGVTGTPTIFINGRRVKKRNFAAFKEMINEELNRIKKAGN
ncbi:MAG: thioredoxin domain-containing protein [Proteobacteria bacterium]|nr:thioredoxin domain-containing protein [Pseudomonadota bacterium]